MSTTSRCSVTRTQPPRKGEPRFRFAAQAMEPQQQSQARLALTPKLFLYRGVECSAEDGDEINCLAKLRLGDHDLSISTMS